MTDLNQFHHFYLMGLKGVAMTSLAQLLLDWHKQVSGCDVADEFVTQKLLNKLQIKVDQGFIHQLPQDVDCVIYTEAHGGVKNPIVLQAQEKKIAIFSQAEALSYFFNQKKGVAVCGVGGKTTVSSMITWILVKNNLQPSFSVGVGEILGLPNTGSWNHESDIFVAEADEYMMNNSNNDEQSSLIPRFSFLNPVITVCTNLEYDHPDVYHSLHHTQQVFTQFFLQTQTNGSLIFNQDCQHLAEVYGQISAQLQQHQIKLKTFTAQNEDKADAILLNSQIINQINQAEVLIDGEKYTLTLKLPGRFNLLNALAATLACQELGVSINDCLKALQTFQGTQRRFEFIGDKKGVLYYDDYAHHPSEIEQTIKALNQWHPNKRKVIVFQPHTYSRTKEMQDEFAQALAVADEVILLDIFPSARENYDPNISSDMLVAKINQSNQTKKVANLKTIESLADYCHNQLHSGDVLLTMGAGDIYQVHELI